MCPKLIQADIHEEYLVEDKDPHVSHADIKPMNIYNHIINCYAKIDLKMAEDNRKLFDKLMDPTKQLAIYTNKQE